MEDFVGRGADIEVLLPGLEGGDFDVIVLGGVQREVSDEVEEHVGARWGGVHIGGESVLGGGVSVLGGKEGRGRGRGRGRGKERRELSCSYPATQLNLLPQYLPTPPPPKHYLLFSHPPPPPNTPPNG